MEAWSHSPVKEFKTTFFVDTNILCYLVDSTYPSLNEFIGHIKQCSMISLISSEYVLLEFVGVRKREHYLREALHQTQAENKPINLSSLLKYHNQYSLPEIEFHLLLPQIKSNVDAEKERITSEFGISFSSGFHRDLFNPTSDICLSSKISKEDSLVLISSVLPNEGIANENVILFTSDADFHSWFNEKELEASINDIFEKHDISKPDLQYIRNINGDNNQRFNLSDAVEMNDVIDNFTSYISKKLKDRLGKLYIGNSFTPQNRNFPNDCVCLKVKSNLPVQKNKHITIIGKKLDFVYNSEHKISFWNNNQEIPDEGFTATDDNNNLSFKIEIDDADPEKANILAKLKEEGNLIFIHPDN
jgi:hypothetical protein